jgi:hypothetical protein
MVPHNFVDAVKYHNIDTKETIEYNDIDSGEVYRNAHKLYIQDNMNEMLCPIIFFIDKTHTDTHGRL